MISPFPSCDQSAVNMQAQKTEMCGIQRYVHRFSWWQHRIQRLSSDWTLEAHFFALCVQGFTPSLDVLLTKQRNDVVTQSHWHCQILSPLFPPVLQNWWGRPKKTIDLLSLPPYVSLHKTDPFATETVLVLFQNSVWLRHNCSLCLHSPGTASEPFWMWSQNLTLIFAAGNKNCMCLCRGPAAWDTRPSPPPNGVTEGKSHHAWFNELSFFITFRIYAGLGRHFHNLFPRTSFINHYDQYAPEGSGCWTQAVHGVFLLGLLVVNVFALLLLWMVPPPTTRMASCKWKVEWRHQTF